jgi:uridine kinase
MLSQDSFYRSLSPDEMAQAKAGSYNFDHPDAFDEPAISQCLTCLLEGRAVEARTLCAAGLEVSLSDAVCQSCTLEQHTSRRNG